MVAILVTAVIALPISPAVAAAAATGAASAVFGLTNQQRVAASVPALASDATLDAAAQAWAEHLVSAPFSHSSNEWRDSMISPGGWRWSGENIAAGQRTPDSVMSAWMNSSGHKANILSSNYNGVGIGYATGGPYGFYWVQIFAQRAPSQPTVPAGSAPTITSNGGMFAATVSGWPAWATGSWSWSVSGVAVPRENSNSFTTSMGDRGKPVTATFTATASGYKPVSKTSSPLISSGSQLEVARLAGGDRYSTAIAISLSGYPSGANTVYVSSGENFPDALAAAPAAALRGGPLLLTPTGSVLPGVVAEIRRLAPDRIVVVGGPNSVSDAVLRALAAVAPTTRVSGSDRYATARAIAADAFVTSSVAYLATGANFPDALAASAAAASLRAPVLLTDGGGQSVDAPTAALLRSLGVTTVRIAGGPATVSMGIENQLKGLGFRVERLGGADRFSTAAAINAQAFATSTTVFVASGYQFPDALAGAALAGGRGAPLFITPQHCFASVTDAAVSALNPARVVLLGGEATLSAGVANLSRC